MLSLNFSSKSPWAIAQYYWNLSLTTYNIIKSTIGSYFFWYFQGNYTITKFFGGHIFTFRKELLQSQEKKTQAFWEFNVWSWIASKFSSCLRWYIIFLTCPAISHFTFHISHITWGIIWYLIIAECFNELY